MFKKSKIELEERKSSSPTKNKRKKDFTIVIVIVIALALIGWVLMIGKKAEQTIAICEINQTVSKNTIITEEMLIKKDMILAEYEQQSVVSENGQLYRRIVTWEEANKLINTFAAHTIVKNTPLYFEYFVASKVDNKDSVLYSFPGTDILELDIGADAISSFKTFLQPGDKLNIDIKYTENSTVYVDNGFGTKTAQQIETVEVDNIFQSLVVADLINSRGESILDLYNMYNELSVWQQAEMDKNADWVQRTAPSKLMAALTPEEKVKYIKYSKKKNVEYIISLPQRVD